MKIEEVKNLALEGVKSITYKRFCDHRGYFTEIMRKSDLDSIENGSIFKGLEFLQANESFSKTGTMRGLHFQWDPFMGKLIRTISGRMIDMVMDIRRDSQNFGKIILFDMPSTPSDENGVWLWVPVGFAHGNFFTEDSTIEYFCTGSYNPEGEAGISPLSEDIDWSLCDEALRSEFLKITSGNGLLMSDKDREGYSLKSWSETAESGKFVLKI
jgi:dTDP-4-dehydrorhamnose 3,5-epimerase